MTETKPLIITGTAGLPAGLDPRARLVSLVLEDANRIPLAIHHGLPDAVERARRALSVWTFGYAAKQAIANQEGRIQACLRELGGRSHQVDHAPGDKEAEEQLLLAQSLARDDAYRATRQIERDYHVEGNDALYALVAAAREEAVAIAATAAAQKAGALRLMAAGPGPTTSLNRALASKNGETVPAEGRLPHALPDARPGEHTLCLGSILVTPAGKHLRKPPLAPIEVTVVVTFDPAGTEFDEDDGSISYADVDFKLFHDPALWSAAEDGLLYGDANTLRGVNGLLKRLGLQARADWSEMGRQGMEAGDMDVDPTIAEELWPQLVAELRSAAAKPTFA